MSSFMFSGIGTFSFHLNFYFICGNTCAMSTIRKFRVPSLSRGLLLLDKVPSSESNSHALVLEKKVEVGQIHLLTWLGNKSTAGSKDLSTVFSSLSFALLAFILRQAFSTWQEEGFRSPTPTPSSQVGTPETGPLSGRQCFIPPDGPLGVTWLKLNPQSQREGCHSYQ